MNKKLEKKELRALIITASVFAVLFVVFLLREQLAGKVYEYVKGGEETQISDSDIAGSVLGNAQSGVATVTDKSQLVDGEELGAANRIMMFPHIPRENIKSISVHNEFGDYEINSTDSGFAIKGHEGITFSGENFSALIVASGYTLTMGRITAEATDEELAEYGLDEINTYWTVTDKSGNSYKVLVGDKLVSGEGYYGMLEGREGCVYVLSTSIENSIFKRVENIVSPMICYGVTEQNYYQIDNLTVMRGDDVFVAVKQCTKDEFTNPDAQTETKLMYPAGYKTDDTYLMSNVLSKFISMTGVETAYIGTDEDEHAKYGLDDPYYKVSFEVGSGDNTLTYILFISEKQKDEDGNYYYYAVSNLNGYKLIAKCSADTFGWLEDDLVVWVDDYPVRHSIVWVDSIGVQTPEDDYLFTLKHGVDSEGNGTLEVDAADGFHLDNSEIPNFREFYKVLLSIQIRGNITKVMGEDNSTVELLDADEIEAIMNNGDSHMLTLKFKMRDGTVNEYSFYRYSTRRAIMSVNGNESFYVLADWIEKVDSDLDNLINNIDIDSSEKN